MKKLLVATCLTCALTLAAHAAEGETKAKPTAEQKALRKEIKERYDTNKDGKLDKEERAKINAADKEKLEKAGLGPKKKKAE